MHRFWIPALVLGALAIAACGGSNGKTSALETQVAALQTAMAAPTATPLPAATPAPTPRDVVVGIIYNCSASREGQLDVQPSSPQGGKYICEAAARDGGRSGIASITVFDIRLTLTVRTAAGSVYSVVIAGPSTISIGDPWPP